MTATGVEAVVVERLVGRPLRMAERAIDILRLDAAMNEAKDEVEGAIRAEVRRKVRRAVLRGSQTTRLEVTRPMLRPLERLYRLGQEEARLELVRLGYDVTGRRMEDAASRIERLRPVGDDLLQGLGRLEAKVSRRLVTLDLTGMSANAVAAALVRVPGGRDVASQLVSRSLFWGMGQTFEEAGDLLSGFEYTAVLDPGTCEVCEPLDGTEYPSWAATQEVLPDGGPNPECLGGDRCRCRAVPSAV